MIFQQASHPVEFNYDQLKQSISSSINRFTKSQTELYQKLQDTLKSHLIELEIMGLPAPSSQYQITAGARNIVGDYRGDTADFSCESEDNQFDSEDDDEDNSNKVMSQ
jgi:hypothetical protein